MILYCQVRVNIASGHPDLGFSFSTGVRVWVWITRATILRRPRGPILA